MKAHAGNRCANLVMIKARVVADKILDLRNADAVSAAGIDLNDAMAPWQEIAESGGVPGSWHVRNRLESLGVKGLIDPSRKAPRLWHLVLFIRPDHAQFNVSIIE